LKDHSIIQSQIKCEKEVKKMGKQMKMMGKRKKTPNKFISFPNLSNSNCVKQTHKRRKDGIVSDLTGDGLL